MKKRRGLSKSEERINESGINSGEVAFETGTAEASKPSENPALTGEKRFRVWARELALAMGIGVVRDPAVLTAALIRGLCFGIMAFLFGRTSLLLDTYPLGIALLCAAEKNMLYIFVGAAVSAFTVTGGAEGLIFSPYVYFAAYLMIVVIRFSARIFIDPPEGFGVKRLFGADKSSGNALRQLRLLFSSRFEENIYLRMATACVSAFLVSLYAMNMGSYRFYDLFSAMFAMVSAPAITFIFSGFFCEGDDRINHLLKNVAVAAMLSASVFALRETYILGVSAAVFVAFGSVLYLARKRGILYASAAGLAAGLAAAPIYAPAFVLAAIVMGVVPGSAFASCAAASGIALLWGVYIDGTGALTALMPALLSSSVLVCASDGLALLPQNLRERIASSGKAYATDIAREESVKERLNRLSATFGELSSALYGISDRLRAPGGSEIRSICARSFEVYCTSCPKNELCHREYGEFSEMVSKLSEILGMDGRIRTKRIPGHISEKCDRISNVSEEANTSFAELLRERITGEKTELFALDYDAVSHIIADALEASDRENKLDVELSDRLRRFCGGADIGMKEIYVRGERKKRIYSGNIGRKAEEMGVRELREELEKACGFPLCDPVFELQEGKVALKTEAAPRFKAESGKALHSRAGESVCGDTAEIFSTPGDSFYAIISDGMGSGQSAAFTSEICTMFLNKMLMGGNRKETSLKMLNTILRSKGEESSATVDLMEIDLITGVASFVKSGAAPSFVRRADKLYKLRSATAPIGIMRAIDAEQVKFDLADGDVIVMLSDGISQSPEECVWLMEMLCGEWDRGESLDGFAERICARAAEEGGGDDASVLLIRVNEISNETKTKVS